MANRKSGGNYPPREGDFGGFQDQGLHARLGRLFAKAGIQGAGGKLNKTELAFCLDRGELAQILREYHLLQYLDLNNDGTIDVEELIERLDTNRDSSISLKEFEDGMNRAIANPVWFSHQPHTVRKPAGSPTRAVSPQKQPVQNVRPNPQAASYGYPSQPVPQNSRPSSQYSTNIPQTFTSPIKYGKPTQGTYPPAGLSLRAELEILWRKADLKSVRRDGKIDLKELAFYLDRKELTRILKGLHLHPGHLLLERNGNIDFDDLFSKLDINQDQALTIQEMEFGLTQASANPSWLLEHKSLQGRGLNMAGVPLQGRTSIPGHSFVQHGGNPANIQQQNTGYPYQSPQKQNVAPQQYQAPRNAPGPARNSYGNNDDYDAPLSIARSSDPYSLSRSISTGQAVGGRVEAPQPQQEKKLRPSAVSNWFKTLTRKGTKAPNTPTEGRETATVYQDLITDEATSEFMTCYAGQQLEIVSRLPDKTVVIKSPRTGVRRLLPSYVFEPTAEQKAAQKAAQAQANRINKGFPQQNNAQTTGYYNDDQAGYRAPMPRTLSNSSTRPQQPYDGMEYGGSQPGYPRQAAYANENTRTPGYGNDNYDAPLSISRSTDPYSYSRSISTGQAGGAKGFGAQPQKQNGPSLRSELDVMWRKAGLSGGKVDRIEVAQRLERRELARILRDRNLLGYLDMDPNGNLDVNDFLIKADMNNDHAVSLAEVELFIERALDDPSLLKRRPGAQIKKSQPQMVNDSKSKRTSAVSTWFKTLTRKSKKETVQDLDQRETILALRDFYADEDASDFSSCSAGQVFEVISRLPDDTIVVKHPQTGARCLLPKHIFEKTAAQIAAEKEAAQQKWAQPASKVMQTPMESLSYDELKFLVRSKKLPPGCPVDKPEFMLTPNEYYTAFRTSQDEFWRLPAWKQLHLRKDAGLV